MAFSLSSRQQVLALTVGALGLYAILRALPTGTNLHHDDFQVTGAGALELCDPANPQFVPVVAVRSPILTQLTPRAQPEVGEPMDFVLRLATSSDKPIGPVDLIIAHTEKLHLLVIDPALRDYQHVHPKPGAEPGEWIFSLTPHAAGEYRVFADFTPVVTGRSIYADAAFSVPGDVNAQHPAFNWSYRAGGLVFRLQPDVTQIRRNQTVHFVLEVERESGAQLQLSEVMGAYAHLVAFDDQRHGFAHLHPDQSSLATKLNAFRPSLSFQLTIPDPGNYVIWAQLAIDGEERYAPFWFEVMP